MAELEITISPLIKDDSAEFRSIFDTKKLYNLQRFNIKALNTRGRENSEAKLGRKMRFVLSPFSILHFKRVELVTTSGGAFSDGNIIQENAGGFGPHTFVHNNYRFFKNLASRAFIPLNLREFKQSIKVILSAIFGREQRRLLNDSPKILWHSLNWDCFSHFSFEEFPRLLATLKAIYEAKKLALGGGQQG